jgi:hypothetical protein
VTRDEMDDKNLATLQERGYDVENISRVKHREIGEITGIHDIRPEYQLVRLKDGQRVMGVIDCSYWQFLMFALQWTENRYYVHGRGNCGPDHPDGDGASR